MGAFESTMGWLDDQTGRRLTTTGDAIGHTLERGMRWAFWNANASLGYVMPGLTDAEHDALKVKAGWLNQDAFRLFHPGHELP